MTQIRIPGMPLLPGSLFFDVGRERYPKSQTFLSNSGVTMLNDKRPAHPPDLQTHDTTSVYPKRVASVPAWLLYDKKVLCFYGYFQEPVGRLHKVANQYRKIKLYYYLEDDTIEILEPKVKNSGIPQGCLLSRQRIPKFSQCPDDFVSMLDINVETTIKIYDRVYKITDCDRFTRHFLNRMGIHVPDPVEILGTPFGDAGQVQNTRSQMPKKKNFPLSQFLKFDRQILKFDAYWDDNSECGIIRNFELLYYLADDSIEIREKNMKNSGRDLPPVFLKKQKLRKVWTGLPLPGEEAEPTLLNVLQRRYMTDSIDVERDDAIYYKDNDLQIGAHLNVFGRDVVLIDCDEFTRNYYRDNYGIESFTPLPNPSASLLISKRVVEKLPPYNGWGEFEDSEANCKGIRPKKAPQDLKSIIKLDKLILRFGAKMISDNKDNSERIFIVSYHLADECVQVFELGLRNSGFLGGEFCKKKKQLLPNQKIFTSERPRYYKPYDFYIGATVKINDHLFYLTSADEYSLSYMEAYPHQFPFSNVTSIIAKVREAIRLTYKDFVCKFLPHLQAIKNNADTSGRLLNSYIFKNSITELLGQLMNDHETLTLCRAFRYRTKSSNEICHREKVRSAVQWEITRNLWNDLDKLNEYILKLESEGLEYISEVNLRTAILRYRLPFSKDLIDLLLSVLNKNQQGKIELRDFKFFVDANECKAQPNTAEPIPKLFRKLPMKDSGQMIDWKAFLDTIGLEGTLEN